MTNQSIAPIIDDEHFRAARARSLAQMVFRSSTRQIRNAIADYGRFTAVSLNPPFDVQKNFLRAVGTLPDYQADIAPLRPDIHRRELDAFDAMFAADVYMLVHGKGVQR